MARRVIVRLGKAWCVRARQARPGESVCGMAWLGELRFGMAGAVGHRVVGLVGVRHGLSGAASSGRAGQGNSRYVIAGQE